MFKLLATVHKEWLMLIRDKTGLLLLFVMPAALVVVITLVQDNVLRQSGGLRISGVLVNQDDGEAAGMLIRELEVSEAVRFLSSIGGRAADEATAGRMIEQGDIQFYAILPKGLSAAVTERVRSSIDGVFADPNAGTGPPGPPARVKIHFDPSVQGIYRTAVNGVVRRAIAVLQAEYSLKYLGEALERQLRHRMGDAGAFTPQNPGRLIPPLESNLLNDPVVHIAVGSTGPSGNDRLPTAVQQNVPAWALFGMFFIVVPISSALIRERREGILARLTVMPVSQTGLVMGKLIAYVGVCLIQFLLIVAVGKWLLPLLGTDRLILTQHLAILVVALCSALAAAGYGIMLGAIVRTLQQAAVFGPVSVVIAAALGGIMVPVFAMPPAMQVISRASPLAWAHDAFMTLLVRQGDLGAVWGQLALLVLFFGLSLVVAMIGLRRQGQV